MLPDLVHELAGVDGGDGEGDVQDERGDGLAEAEGAVDAQVEVAVVRLVRVAQLPVRPHLQPHVRAHRDGLRKGLLVVGAVNSSSVRIFLSKFFPFLITMSQSFF